MEIYWIPCFLCKIREDDFKGKGKLEIGDNFNKFAKFKTDICPLCGGIGRLAVKPCREKLWEKDRKDYL